MNGHYKVGDVVLSNWTLARLLGQDNAGSVFEAVRNDSGQAQKSAIKIITIPQNLNDIKNIMADGMDKNSVIEYFRGSIGDLLEEFLLMTELQGCSNIVHYDEHQVAQHTEGIGWDIILRMELLTPLLDYAHVKPLRRENILQLGIDICYALEHCAEQSIIHRDIKPGNIFISHKGEFLLGDFGIARTIEKTSGGFTKNAYTAPELYRGEQYDETVDIYSLGVVLYRMLNMNRTPFMPDYPMPITHNAREMAISKQLQGVKFPPPKNADSQLAKVILRACAFRPEDRYATPTLMREDLEAVLTGREISAVPLPFGVPDTQKKSAMFNYDEPESGFYEILKDKGAVAPQKSSDFDDDPFSDTDAFSGKKESMYKEPTFGEPVRQDTSPIDSPRKIDFENELYDDAQTGNTFITTAIEFLRERLVFVGIIGAAVLAIIIAVLVLNPLGGGEDAVDPSLDEEEPEPVPQIETVRIPDFRNQSYIEVLTDARFQDVFTFEAREIYDDEVPEGHVISQNPEPNSNQQLSPLGDRIRINLVVSMGQEPSPFDAITLFEVRYGANPLPGRGAGNPGFTLSLSNDSTIVLTCRIEPPDFYLAGIGNNVPAPPENGEEDGEDAENGGGTTTDTFEYEIEWISTNEDIFVITSTNPADNTARITAMGTGSAILLVRLGDTLEDRVTVTVAN